MNRKYRQQGYQDSPREPRERGRTPPAQPLTPEERAQLRASRHAVQREANEVMRCPNCGRNVVAFGTVGFETLCPHCTAPLHACRACRHFDTSARWECRAAIPAHLPEKSKANTCTFFEARLVLDATGKRTGASGASNDPKSQFESLFKR
jgi:predicted RNA-binding Zn-ribbon protein involved in translation (DUF1610 family)